MHEDVAGLREQQRAIGDDPVFVEGEAAARSYTPALPGGTIARTSATRCVAGA
ncbi:MAG TPA: hypothetical protein VFA48_10910 [Gammaproteobacteria bacterium]|nr:hypothetical protein [Gammaproteobacteria bacterium]